MPHGAKKLDIAVCGCGPAGLAAALLLSREGHRVRIFDQFESPRPLGSGLILQPTGLAVLHSLGLLPQIESLGARIDRLFGRAVPSHKVVLDVRYRALSKNAHAIAVHRAALFGVLYDAVKAADINIATSQRIARIEREPARAMLIGAPARSLGRFDLIVDALGANSPLADGIAKRTVLEYGALWTTVALPAGGVFQSNALEQRYWRASRMAGVLPIGRRSADAANEAAFFWSIKRQDVARWRERGIEAWKEDMDGLWPESLTLLDEVRTCSDMTFAQYDHFTAARPWSERLVHIGDAAHATSPQLGQGANMALLDAFALARALATNDNLAAALEHYVRMRRRHIHIFQWASAIFTPFYQSDSRALPWLRDQITAPISRLPMADALLARLVSGMTVPPLAGISLRMSGQ